MMIFFIINGTAISQVRVVDVEDAQLDERILTGQFSQFLEGLRKDLKIPGLSAAIVKDGQILWAQGFGFANIEKKINATPQTSYYLASLTKTFASTIIMQLVEQGKLDLDAPVSMFDIKIRSPGIITVRHLLSHTSEGQPGTFFRYNGYRFQFLGQMIRKVSGRSFKDLLIENILKPLDMKNTAPNVTADEYSGSFTRVFENLTEPYALDKDGYVIKGHFHDSFGVSGGLISTVLDMAKYDIALQQNILLRPATQEMAFTPFITKTGERLPYGLGWFSQVYNGVRLIWHYGYYPPSISTLILKAPDEKMTLIVFANTDALSRYFPIGEDVLYSPLVVTFFKMFIFPRKTSRILETINWESGGDEIISQLEQEKDEGALDLYKRELMSYWRVVYNMGHKEKASRLLEVYSRLFSKKERASLKNRRVIAGISGVGDNEYRVVEFTLVNDTRVRVYGIGEGGRFGMSDFGGIENTSTGKLVWLMDYKETVHAGGIFGNRLVNKVISLSPGTYRLHYKTNNAHSFKQWLWFPPDHSFWGIVLYDEEPTGISEDIGFGQGSQVSQLKEITAFQRLLDSAITGEQPEEVIGSGLRLIMMVCFVIFLLGFVIWPIGKGIRFLKRRKSKNARIAEPKAGSKLSAAVTFIAWINAVLGLFFVVAAIFRGSLEFLLKHGIAEKEYFEVKLIFTVILFAPGCISILLVCFSFWEWRKRYRSLIGRLFYTVFTACTLVFVIVCYHWYLALFA